jgi:atypical dual specificity phosphatase
MQEIFRRAKEDIAFRELFMNDPRVALAEYNLPEEVLRNLILPNFSWLVEGKLAASARPTAVEAFELLQKSGIRTVLTLTETCLPPERLEKYGLTAHHLPIADMDAPSVAQIDEAVKVLRQEVQNEAPVLVHCAAGLGRTGTILACYLVSEEGFTAEEAIARVRALRPGSIETPQQEAVIAEYAQQKN